MDDVKLGAVPVALGTSKQPYSDLRLILRLIGADISKDVVVMPRDDPSLDVLEVSPAEDPACAGPNFFRMSVACSASSPSEAVSTTQVPCSNSTHDLRGSPRSRCQTSSNISVFTPIIMPQSTNTV
jgi:hypothetical protein